ncbi:hypothetical protein ACET3X_005744 [Alternaria dauci]|uniref:Uncharacterized protein n=1 Tax=Alternaria dauci TaxID=48095 RepID=A0ABR3UGP5_9PLEO
MARRLTTTQFDIKRFQVRPLVRSLQQFIMLGIFRIGGLVVKLAVAILHRTVSASPGFDSRPMQRLL